MEHGETAYERATGMVYKGKICMFGERIMNYLKTTNTGKEAPRWVECVWLGKTMLNDVNVVWAPSRNSWRHICHKVHPEVQSTMEH